VRTRTGGAGAGGAGGDTSRRAWPRDLDLRTETLLEAAAPRDFACAAPRPTVVATFALFFAAGLEGGAAGAFATLRRTGLAFAGVGFATLGVVERFALVGFLARVAFAAFGALPACGDFDRVGRFVFLPVARPVPGFRTFERVAVLALRRLFPPALLTFARAGLAAFFAAFLTAFFPVFLAARLAAGRFALEPLAGFRAVTFFFRSVFFATRSPPRFRAAGDGMSPAARDDRP